MVWSENAYFLAFSLFLKQCSVTTVYIALHYIRYYKSSRGDLKYRRYAEVLCQYYTISYKGIEFAWVWYPGGSGTTLRNPEMIIFLMNRINYVKTLGQNYVINSQIIVKRNHFEMLFQCP